MSRLMEPLDFRKLTEEGVEFQVDSKYVKDDDEFNSEEEENDSTDAFQHCNKECIGVFDEEVYDEQPFEVIARKMENLTPDGKIKKRVIKEGNGEKPLEYATVKIHYNAYKEYEDEPFDSTYMRRKPRKFLMNDGRVIAGLDFAVKTMRVNEKSQFLIHPDYAFGKNCFGQVPPDTTVLFEVELLEVVNSGAVLTYENLSEDQQTLFSEVYKYCTALSERGKNLFTEHQYMKAIKDYNTAAARLNKVVSLDKEELKAQRELLLKLYTNLLICYTRAKQFRKGCANAQKIYDLTENAELMKIPAKVYFNHAKCLRILGEYAEAKAILDKAYHLEPKNPEIANEMFNLENDKLEHKKKQMMFAKALVGGATK